MSLKINYNVSAMIANNALKQNDNKLSSSLERLSSGYKINHGKDNPAGLAIARRMNAQIKGLKVANQDAKDGESVVEIADGALSEVHDMLQRMNELAVKSANGTMTDLDRTNINDEIVELQAEITRIGQTTEFNGQKLLDGSFDLKGYTTDNNVKVNYYSDDVSYGEYDLELFLAYDDDKNLAAEGTDKNGAPATTTATLTRDGKTIDVEVKIDSSNNQIILNGEKGFQIKLGINDKFDAKVKDPATPDKSVSLKLDLTGIGAMTLQIGANEGQVIDIRIPELSLKNMDIADLNVLTVDDALTAIDKVDNAIQFISKMRSKLGAYQNRLEHTESNLSISDENMTAAFSRIMDTDMAEEMTQYTSLNVVTQAATSVLAQANERPSQMLQLLQ